MNRLYIVIRNDLNSMNPGKAMAQCSHASAQFVTKHPNEAAEWSSEADGFGSTVVMEGNINDIVEAFQSPFIKKHVNGKVVDPTYPFRVQKELLNLVAVPNKIKLQIDPESEVDKYGMVSATREETTCYWVYVENEESAEMVKASFNTHNIHLCR